jgi:hypothetical protein
MALHPRVRLFGVDKVEIGSLPAWFDHAPPEKGEAQWRDGYSAKEQAKAWLRPGTPAAPEEWWTAVSDVAGPAEEIYARPEHQTALDRYPRKRQHDLFACLRRNGAMRVAIGVEAKACEDYDGIVSDRASAGPPSRKRARCNLLALALFGRPVFDEDTGEVLDHRLAGHGYQLWTAAVGTLIEAQSRSLDVAIVVVHQFRPTDLAAAAAAGDQRPWQSALERNTAAFATFAEDLATAGSRSNATEFVNAGTRLHAVKVESVFESSPL